jgi:hypothetical protein
MRTLLESGSILPVFIPHLAYQRCDSVPELPRAGTVPLMEEQWAPAFLRRGPFPDLTAEEEEEEQRVVDALLKVTLATLGAAPIH